MNYVLEFHKLFSGLKKQLLFRFIIALLLLLFLGSDRLYAQSENEVYNRQKRAFIGGNLGLQFGTITILDVSPYIGYKMTNSLSLGAGFTYQYYRDGRGDDKYSSSIYGGRIFTTYSIIPEVFAYAEYEMLNFEVLNSIGEEVRKNVSSVLVGGGYRQMIGPNMYSDIMILWNLTESIDSPYTNPIYRVGISIGL